MTQFDLSDEEMYTRMKNGWVGGLSGGTECGGGSLLKNTESIRSALPRIIEKYNIKSVNDAGCGDLSWISKIDLPDYKGYDLVKRHPDVTEIDITTEKMRSSDLIICRDVFIHLTADRVQAALSLFRETGKYLLASSYYVNENDQMAADKMFVRVSLTHPPFNLGEPLEKVDEHHSGRFVGLWEL